MVAANTMSNSSLTTSCPAPFLNEAQYPYTGGIFAGRLCSSMSHWAPDSNLICCLPCPSTDYIYPKDFVTWYRISEGFNAISVALCSFLLVSFIALPTDKTKRHYLSVCLVIVVIVEGLGFVVPLAVRPDQCYDAITPNDMFSSLTCAWSGALIIAGGLGINVWIFVRALSIHLQICWDVSPGMKFFYSAQAAGWGILAVMFTLTTTITGFAFRYGDACHVNSKDGMKTFWGPLLGLVALSTLIQAATTAYCVNVFLRNFWSNGRDIPKGDESSYPSNINAYSAKAVYQRVRKCLWMQWRSMLVVIFLLADVVFFSVVFLYMDAVTAKVKAGDLSSIMPWLICLTQNGRATGQCLKLGQDATIKESTVIAVLMLLALAGTQVFLLTFRRSMLQGWRELFAHRMARNGEFISIDARRTSPEYEKPLELSRFGSTEPLAPVSISPSKDRDLHVEVTPINTTPPAYNSAPWPLANEHSQYRGHQPHQKPKPAEVSRKYRAFARSFTGPRTPAPVAHFGEEPLWDPQATYAKGRLA